MPGRLRAPRRGGGGAARRREGQATAGAVGRAARSSEQGWGPDQPPSRGDGFRDSPRWLRGELDRVLVLVGLTVTWERRQAATG